MGNGCAWSCRAEVAAHQRVSERLAPIAWQPSPAKPRRLFTISTIATPPPASDLLPARRCAANMLYLVGLGLADEKDITVKGLEVVKKAERVYLEAYTAILLVNTDALVSLRQQMADHG